LYPATLLEELGEATRAGTRKDYLAQLSTVPLLVIDNRYAVHRV